MPETLFHRDFSAGWIPSDDQVDGRANGLLQMDNLELDRNGALQLIHGTNVVYSGYPTLAHTMFSRFINGTRYDYAALDDGSVYRNSTPVIASGGDGFNAAFGTAFNYILICSGAKRFKDDGTTLTQLGVNPPTVAPTATQPTLNAPYALVSPALIYGNVGLNPGLVVVAGSASNAGGTNYLHLQTNAAPGPGIVNPNTSIVQAVNYPVSDLTHMSGVSGSGTSTDDDFITLNGYMDNPFGMYVQFDVLLSPGDALGDIVNDYYTFTVPDLSKQADFNAYSGQFTLRMKRSDFQRIGGGPQDWTTTYGFRITFIGSPLVMINIWGVSYGSPLIMQGGTAAQFGTYEYMQINVNNTGSYIAKSVPGPASKPITIQGNCALITPQNPTTVDPQVNEVWIYRRSVNGDGLLNQWYRVLVIKSPWAATYDTTGDQAALNLDITANLNLVSIQSITDKIYDIIGPIQGRWFYFTVNFMYPSDINDPDLVNPSISIRTAGSASELHMWARAVSASVVLVGTTVDCYLLTGTLSTFPDGTIDSYYQQLGVKFPPVTYDAVIYGGAVYYYAADGWRMVLPTSFGTTYAAQNNQLIVSPNIDRLYKGETCYGYLPPRKMISPGLARFPVTIAKNKLWCFILGTGRCEVYDFLRQYWRTFNYQLGDASACFATQDNRVLAFYPNDKKMREVDFADSKLIDGATKQIYTALFCYKDNDKPRQRKDTYTFKSRCATGTGYMQVIITDDAGNNYYPTPTIKSPGKSTEQFVDLSAFFGPVNQPDTILPKSYQVLLQGVTDDIYIEDWSLIYDPHPEPLTFLRIQPNNLGSASQKRVRTWPLVIDTLGNYVIFTPNVDGAPQSKTSTFNSTYRKTHFHYFTDDVFGVDYGGTLQCTTGMMEVWSTGLDNQGPNPDIVQNLPIPHEYDQVGPLEIFRWGKVMRMALRTQSSGTPIPFKIFISDVLIWTGQFDVTPGVEDEYVVDLPKGVSGRILRVELGPCGFTFSRYFMKFQVMISGAQKDTEVQWITVPGLTSELAKGI